jgi:hypothetical protein
MDATFRNGDLMNRTYRKIIQEAEMDKHTRVWCGSGDLAPRGGAKAATETPARVSVAGGLSFFLSHDIILPLHLPLYIILIPEIVVAQVRNL